MNLDEAKNGICAIPDVPANDADFNKFLEVTLSASKMMQIPQEMVDIIQDTASIGWKFGAMYGAKKSLLIMAELTGADIAEQMKKEGDK